MRITDNQKLNYYRDLFSEDGVLCGHTCSYRLHVVTDGVMGDYCYTPKEQSEITKSLNYYSVEHRWTSGGRLVITRY